MQNINIQIAGEQCNVMVENILLLIIHKYIIKSVLNSNASASVANYQNHVLLIPIPVFNCNRMQNINIEIAGEQYVIIMKPVL